MGRLAAGALRAVGAGFVALAAGVGDIGAFVDVAIWLIATPGRRFSW